MSSTVDTRANFHSPDFLSARLPRKATWTAASLLVIASTLLGACESAPAPRAEIAPPPVLVESPPDYSTSNLLSVEATAIAGIYRPAEYRQADIVINPESNQWQVTIENTDFQTYQPPPESFVFLSFAPAQSLHRPAFLPGEAVSPEGIVAAFSEGASSVFRGFLLPVTIADFSISGGLNRMIEGSTVYPFFDNQGKLSGFLEFYPQSTTATYFDAKGQQNTFDVNAAVVYAQDVAKAEADAEEAMTTSQAISDAQNNPGWEPPNIKHCNEKIDEHFGGMLFSEILGKKIIDRWRLSRDSKVVDDMSIPMNKGSSRISQQVEETNQRMVENGCEEYKQGDGRRHSIFMDYKIMRERWLMKLGEKLGYSGDTAVYEGYKYMLNQFNLEMSTQEALAKCTEIVATWWTLP